MQSFVESVPLVTVYLASPSAALVVDDDLDALVGCDTVLRIHDHYLERLLLQK